MDFRFRRIGSNIPKPVAGPTWLSDCRMLFLHGKPLGRAMVGKFSGKWGGVLYLSITNDSDLLKREPLLNELKPGLYVDVSNNAQVTEDQSVKLKPGIRDIYEFLRLLQVKKLRKDREAEWRLRSNTLRRINESAEWLEPGVYEIVTYDDRNRAAWPDPNQLENVTLQENDDELVRSPDFASGGISVKERNLFVEQMIACRKHALRTDRIDRNRLTAKVGQFYHEFGFKPPQVIVLPNPLTATIAGAFAAVLLFKEKHGIDSNSDGRLGSMELLSKYVAQTVPGTASWSTRNCMDRLTSTSASNFIDPELVSSRFSDDAIRFLDQREFGGFETSYIDPDWTVNSGCIYDAINTVLSQPNRFVAKPKNTRLRTLLNNIMKHLDDDDTPFKNTKLRVLVNSVAKLLGGGDKHLTKTLLWFPRSGRDVLLESNIVAVASFGMNVLHLKLPVYETYAIWEKLVFEGAAFVMHQEFCFVSEFPKFIQLDDRNRLHCETGPAIKWRDGWSVYYWHGTPVPNWIIEKPKSITIEIINSATNQEFRRVLIDRYGVSRYLVDSGAAEFQRDKYGVLYCQNLGGAEPLVMVRVTNSTPEPDGSVKEYFLRVPPTVRTAEEAVAWTFGLREDEYNPTIET